MSDRASRTRRPRVTYDDGWVGKHIHGSGWMSDELPLSLAVEPSPDEPPLLYVEMDGNWHAVYRKQKAGF